MVDVPPSRSVLCPRDGRPCLMKDDLDLESPKVRLEERQARPVWWKDHRQLIKKDAEAKETKDLEDKIANIFQNKRVSRRNKSLAHKEKLIMNVGFFSRFSSRFSDQGPSG